MLHIFHGFSLSFLPSFLTPPWLHSYLLLHWLQTTASGALWGGPFLPLSLKRNPSPLPPLKSSPGCPWMARSEENPSENLPPGQRYLGSFHHPSQIIHCLHTLSWWPMVISYKLKVLWPTLLFKVAMKEPFYCRLQTVVLSQPHVV